MSVLPQKLFNPNGYLMVTNLQYLPAYDIDTERQALDNLRACRINELKSLVHQFANGFQNRVVVHTTHQDDTRKGIEQAIQFHVCLCCWKSSN